MHTRRDWIKLLLRILLAVFFVAAGILHYTKTSFYLQAMPPYLPRPRELVWVSGVFEILGGIGVLVPATQRFSGYGLIALLIAVFPANIQMAADSAHNPNAVASSLLLWLRLPLQFALVYWVWWCALSTNKTRTINADASVPNDKEHLLR